MAADKNQYHLYNIIMKVTSIILALVTLVMVTQNVVVAQKEQTLDRETIEWILQNIDSDCKEEMQNAMANQGDLSDKCKSTIQKMMMDKLFSVWE